MASVFLAFPAKTGPMNRFARRLGAALIIVALMPGAVPASQPLHRQQPIVEPLPIGGTEPIFVAARLLDQQLFPLGATNA